MVISFSRCPCNPCGHTSLWHATHPIHVAFPPRFVFLKTQVYILFCHPHNLYSLSGYLPITSQHFNFSMEMGLRERKLWIKLVDLCFKNLTSCCVFLDKYKYFQLLPVWLVFNSGNKKNWMILGLVNMECLALAQTCVSTKIPYQKVSRILIKLLKIGVNSSQEILGIIFLSYNLFSCWFGCVLWYINPCKLFNAKSSLYV